MVFTLKNRGFLFSETIGFSSYETGGFQRGKPAEKPDNMGKGGEKWRFRGFAAQWRGHAPAPSGSGFGVGLRYGAFRL